MHSHLRASFLIAHTEVPISSFAASIRPNWLVPAGEVFATETPNGYRPPLPSWAPTLGQPILSVPSPIKPAAPWLYGETPDLNRLIGNAVPGYGA